jgi:uncharacterized delta-60 repeat protein
MFSSSWLRNRKTKPRANRVAFRPRLELLEDRLAPSAGQLDPTFGTGGAVFSDFELGLSIHGQPDGKITVVGANRTTGDLSVARYNPDGSLDAGFGSGGITTAPVSIGADAATIDAAGRIILAGFEPFKNDYGLDCSRFAVMRLRADGNVDTGFGQSGKTTFSIAGAPFAIFGVQERARAVTVDAAGRIVVAGSEEWAFSSLQYSAMAVARLNGDGSLDSTFGQAGSEQFRFGGTPGTVLDGDPLSGASAVTMDPLGRIVLAGGSTRHDGNAYPHNDFALARLNADGSLDTSFAGTGKTTIRFGLDDSARAVSIDSAGRIVVAGSSETDSWLGIREFAVACLDDSGALDPTFGLGGRSTVDFTADFPLGSGTLQDMRIGPNGSIALAGVAHSAYDYLPSSFAVALLRPDGLLDADFGVGGKVLTDFRAAGHGTLGISSAAFDAAARLVVAAMVTAPSGPPQLALFRYLGHDAVAEAGSATFATDLQAAVTALRATPPPGTPRVAIHVSDPGQMPGVDSAIAGLTVNPAGPTIEVVLDVDPGSYPLGSISVPAGLKLLLDGRGSGVPGVQTFASSSGPVLTLVSGDVLIRNGAALASTGGSTIVVQGGQLTLRNSTVTETTTSNQAAIAISGGQVDLGTFWNWGDPNYGGNTINVNGPGMLIRLTGPNNLMAFGDSFVLNGVYLTDNYQIEDLIDHSLDGFGPGTVFWVSGNVFVTTRDAVIQRGVNVVPAGGSVNVQTGVKGDYSVGSKLLSIAYQSGQNIIQQADSLDATKRELLVGEYAGNNTVKFVAGSNPGEVQVNINSLPSGTFLPTGRLIAHAGWGDSVTVDSTLTLSAWLYGDGGNDRLKGGGGNNVLIGNAFGDVLIGGSGRNVLIGTMADRLVSNGGQDILIAGWTYYIYDEVALGAILAEWSSADSLAARVANLTDNTASPYFSASRLNGNYFLIQGQTVFNDYSADTVTAGSGPDWIFASSWDKVNGLSAADVEFIFG